MVLYLILWPLTVTPRLAPPHPLPHQNHTKIQNKKISSIHNWCALVEGWLRDYEAGLQKFTKSNISWRICERD